MAKKRTAKQIAATKALVRLNKARKSGGAKKRSKKGGASSANLAGRVSNLEKRVSSHGTRLSRVETTLGGVTGYLMDTIEEGILPPVKSKR